MKKYMGNKKEVLFILSSDDCGDWLVCGSGDSVSVRTYQSFQTGESYIQGGHLPGKEINDDPYGQKRIISD